MDFATQLFEEKKLCQNSDPTTVSVAAPSKPSLDLLNNGIRENINSSTDKNEDLIINTSPTMIAKDNSKESCKASQDAQNYSDGHQLVPCQIFDESSNTTYLFQLPADVCKNIHLGKCLSFCD